MMVNIYYCIEYNKDIIRIDLIGTHNSVKLVYNYYNSKCKTNKIHNSVLYCVKCNNNKYIIEYFMCKVLIKLKKYFNKGYYSQIDPLYINNKEVIGIFQEDLHFSFDFYHQFTLYQAYFYEIRDNINDYFKRCKENHKYLYT